jgi:hypothetical protein
MMTARSLPRIFPLLVLLLVGYCVSGCGYHPLISTVVHDAGSVKSIYIPVFVNRSYRATLEAFLANSITEQFARRRGAWRVAGEDAEYLLSGTIVSYDSLPVAYNYQNAAQLETVAEYRATITAEISLRKSGSRSILWKRRLSLYQNFPANSDIAIQQNSEDAAIQEVCQKLAQDIYVSLSDDF